MFKKTICTVVLAVMLCFTAFAASKSWADDGTPSVGNEFSNSAPVSILDVAAIDAGTDRQSVPAFEVAISPPEIAVATATIEKTHRTAAEICSKHSAGSLIASYRLYSSWVHPDTPSAMRSRFDEPDVARVTQPLSKRIEATARSGSLEQQEK